MYSWSSEQKVLGLIELNNNVSLSEGNSSGGEGVVEVAVEPEEEFLPHLPFGLFSFRSLESVEDLRSVSDTITNGNTLGLEGHFLTNVSEVTDLLVSLEFELSVEYVVPLCVVVKRISVHFELNSLNHALTWEVAVVHIIGN